MILQTESVHQNVQKLSEAKSELNSLENLMDQKNYEMTSNKSAVGKTRRKIKKQKKLLAKEVDSRAHESCLKACKFTLLEFLICHKEAEMKFVESLICEKEAEMKFNEIHIEFYKLQNLEKKFFSDAFLERIAKSVEETNKILSKETRRNKKKLSRMIVKKTRYEEALRLQN
jgi:hypothetical protein